MKVYLKESVEFQPVIVELDGAVIEEFDVCIVPYRARPEDWQSPTVLEGQPGIMIQGLEIGTYDIYVRITHNPEIPVIPAGQVVIR